MSIKEEKLKEDFIDLISHEMRTPLTTIQWTLEYFLGGFTGEISPLQRDYLKMAEKDSRRLGVIIDDLIDIYRIQSAKINLKKEKTDILRLINDCILMMKGDLELKRITVVKRASTYLPYAYIDQQSISDALIKLLDNAIKFSCTGKEIRVSAAAADRITISVEDYGCGIDPKMLPRIFKKFEQLTRIIGPGRQGIGLGLSIAKALVELNGGEIKIESKKGEGTKASIAIPLLKNSEGGRT
ncbi:hypothetical protein A2276_07735 [candidate division WOR-1 bacterium RIFOXYA12_FULL_43_27]|uniref:histidine kinase n=1 Tax=candidate division WOR-1 bacterium RIFOXYC2_FULL_46_14 TaxID=1802587 RepID=A0A1F4U7Q8_UNCSA|nr:MAG: hypothetical protein A2276_07735 [candidate division WOR-1 bacterium RIFOXYA12_FULL_43_27]OGC20489.1 MAG: hypothetical protein A2292_05560 [candidate division WOR-1 bacterium RIFOXYB2_FULL_46_45]OGC31774.1 MAG: hypothetical protein A2232_05890 [candidate division WOR-1 bacterium RIFOXYA2_FULL_46_56]OGC40333.1 MAG: hypothetical protein A2438_03580 [candidate division WOR-1 bacterium RIFOXYC2_FULL_46_14]